MPPRSRAKPVEVEDPDEVAGRALDGLPDDGVVDPHVDDDDDDADPDDDDDEVGEGDPKPDDDDDAGDDAGAGDTGAGDDDAGDGASPAASAPRVSRARTPRPPRIPARPRAPRAPRENGELYVSPVPRGIRGPRGLSAEQAARSPALRAAQSFQEAGYREVDDIMAGLNFAQREYKIIVERLEPDFDENEVPCTGELATYKQAVTVADIRRRFGGGTYRVRVWGPHPTTGGKGFIKQEVFKIPGYPALMVSRKKPGGSDDNAAGGIGAVLQVIADTNERTQERMVAMMERSTNQTSPIAELLPTVTSLIEKMLAKSEAAATALAEAQREDRRLADEARREERKREEDRRAAEKAREEKREDQRRADEAKAEERRRADEIKAEDRRREQIKEEREAAREARDAERERAREERDRARDEAKKDADDKQRQHERDLAAQTARLADDKERNREHLASMQRDQERRDARDAQQMDLLMQRQESGGLESVTKQLLMLKDLKGALTGEDQEPSGMEKFSEGLERVTATVMPVAQQAMSMFRRSGPAPAAQQQQGQPQQGGFAPGQQPKPLIVDLGPRRAALPPGQPQQNPGGMPPIGQPVYVNGVPQQAQANQGGMPPVGQPMQRVQQPMTVQAMDQAFAQAQQPQGMPTQAMQVQQPQATQGQGHSTQGQGQGEPALVNEYTSFVFPAQGQDMLEAGGMLIRNVDLAVQRGFTPQQIVTQILNPFEEQASMLMAMASGLDAEGIIEFMSTSVPGDWAILSPRGEELVTKAFELWRTQPEQGGR